MSVNSQFGHVLQLGTSGPMYILHSHDRVEVDLEAQVEAGMIHVDDIKVSEINQAVLSTYSPTNQTVIAKGAVIDEVIMEIKAHGQELRWIGMAEHDGDRYTLMHGV